MPESIACESRISRVVVYARGAVVTREVELPAGLPAEAVDLLVGGLTPMAEAGSIRTAIEGERRITGVQSVLTWPQAQEPTPLPVDQLRVLERESRRHSFRIKRLQVRAGYLQSNAISADLRTAERDPGAPIPGINQRLEAHLGSADLLHDLLEKIQAEIHGLTAKVIKLNQDIAALEDRRVDSADTGARRQVRISLAAGSDHLRTLEVSYSVAPARWWPAYAARLSNGGRNAEFAVEAFVAQNTQEDWKDAIVSLCTADMISDLTLPELQSLRLGRSQPAKRTGFREPPEGLEAMFEAHDVAFGLASAPAGNIAYAEAPEEEEYDDMDGAVVTADYDERVRDSVNEQHRGRGGASAKRKMAPKPPPAPVAMSAPSGAMPVVRAMATDDSLGGGMAESSMPAPEPAPAPTDVSDVWMDFDSLELAGADNTGHRGRLVDASELGHREAYFPVGDFIYPIEALDAPGGATDPLHTRGMFDHRFDADGKVEISADGRAQRVRLMAKPAKSRISLRCVPLEDERVFREVAIDNPLEAPLLPGPVDVFMDGALLITSEVDATDRGGTIRFGLGEEQRVRVVRNVRAREESKGVFGGKIAMDHDVSLEVASSLSADVEIELVDRLPVTEDKDIDIELLNSQPKAEHYDQSERNAHVKGGLRWKLNLKAGATAKAEFSYRIGFDKDYELNGGNRRE